MSVGYLDLCVQWEWVRHFIWALVTSSTCNKVPYITVWWAWCRKLYKSSLEIVLFFLRRQRGSGIMWLFFLLPALSFPASAALFTAKVLCYYHTVTSGLQSFPWHPAHFTHHHHHHHHRVVKGAGTPLAILSSHNPHVNISISWYLHTILAFKLNISISLPQPSSLSQAKKNLITSVQTESSTVLKEQVGGSGSDLIWWVEMI